MNGDNVDYHELLWCSTLERITYCCVIGADLELRGVGANGAALGQHR
jgi:hypothetical protein